MKYLFTPEILDALPEELAELFRGLEDTLLKEICSRLRIADQLNEVTVQDIRVLRSHGISLKEIEDAIRRVSNISQEKLDELLDDVVERNRAYYGDLADLAQITAPEQMLSIEDTWAIYEQTKTEMRNITQSMGFIVRQNGRALQALQPAKAYQWALDQAEMQVTSGAISYNQAISSAVKQLADSGLKRIYYEHDGKFHYEQADVAARRAIMTGVNQLCQKYAEQSAEWLETDVVEVSAHKGARNTGIGPSNHAEWQGKLYSRSGKKYPNFEDVTGYGTGPGLGGWNCRHHWYPFVDGVMERTYTDEQLSKIDNPPFEYEGKVYDQYAASQKQREIERTIRKLKREYSAFEAAGLSEDAQSVSIRIRRLNAEYRAFSEAAGLPMQRERTKILYT